MGREKCVRREIEAGAEGRGSSILAVRRILEDEVEVCAD